MADDSYVPQNHPWDRNVLHILFAVLFGFANSLYCLFFWFTWLFGGSPQNPANLRNYVQAATIIAVLPGAILAAIACLLPIPSKFKIGYALAALAPPILYSAYQAIRLYSAL